MREPRDGSVRLHAVALGGGRRPGVDVRLTRRGLALVHGRNPVMRIGARIPNGRIGSSRGVTELLVELPPS